MLVPLGPEPTGAEMSLPRSVADLLSEHVTLEVEGIDRMYLNVYVPQLQREPGVACFFRFHRGHLFASSALMDPISKTFVAAIDQFARRERIPVVLFRKGQRKDDIAADYLRKFTRPEGVVFIGKAQEKTPVFRTERRRNENTGATYPWLVRSTAMVNQFYLYCLDRDFGPFFLKFSTYFPYNAKLCLNGHEYAKGSRNNNLNKTRKKYVTREVPECSSSPDEPCGDGCKVLPFATLLPSALSRTHWCRARPSPGVHFSLSWHRSDSRLSHS